MADGALRRQVETGLNLREAARQGERHHYLRGMIVERRTEIPTTTAALFDWHSRPGAFERLTPPWERVRLTSPHPGITPGSRVTLDIAVGPVHQRWVARHESVDPGRGFVDVQEEGPFVRWRHTHRFEALDSGRAALTDRIECELPGGPLAELGEPMVRRKLRRMLAYRHAVTAADLALHARTAGLPRLTVAITGASGLVGRTVMAMLTTGGHRVIPLVRRPASPGEIRWDPARGELDPSALAGIDAVIHLAGESIAASRWTDARRVRILSSRVDGTTTIARAMAAASPHPRVLLSASAVGYYGDRGDAELDETAGPGTGFLAEVTRAWEEAAGPARDAGIRTVFPRLGVVLSPAGGALAKLLPIFRLGLGGPVGTGRQYMSWISVDDCAAALVMLLTANVEGPVNLTAGADTNRDFAATLGSVLHRPAVLSVPAQALHCIFGQMADETLLAGARCLPRRLLGLGYEFRHPDLATALRHVVGRNT